MLVTAAMSFCLNAGITPWDHAAGVLIHSEAGGYAALVSGEPYRPTMTDGFLLSAPDQQSWEEVRKAVFED